MHFPLWREDEEEPLYGQGGCGNRPVKSGCPWYWTKQEWRMSLLWPGSWDKSREIRVLSTGMFVGMRWEPWNNIILIMQLQVIHNNKILPLFNKKETVCAHLATTTKQALTLLFWILNRHLALIYLQPSLFLFTEPKCKPCKSQNYWWSSTKRILMSRCIWLVNHRMLPGSSREIS